MAQESCSEQRGHCQGSDLAAVKVFDVELGANSSEKYCPGNGQRSKQAAVVWALVSASGPRQKNENDNSD